MLQFDDSGIFNIQESLFTDLVHVNLEPHPNLIKKIDHLQSTGNESNKYLANQLRSSIAPTTYTDLVSGEKIEHWWSIQAVKITPGAGLRPNKMTSDILKYYCFGSEEGDKIAKAYNVYSDLHCQIG